jgi:hypothetical protein
MKKTFTKIKSKIEKAQKNSELNCDAIKNTLKTGHDETVKHIFQMKKNVVKGQDDIIKELKNL